MSDRNDLREELGGIMSNPNSYQQQKNDMKRLQVINAEVLLEALDTLDRIDARLQKTEKSNQKLAKISANLGKTNNTLQKSMVVLTVLVLIVAIATLVVAI